MNNFHQYLIPWSISQAASLLILFLAFRKPVWARYIFAVIFIAAGIFNWVTSTGWPFLVRHAIGWIENGAQLDPLFKRLFYLIMRYGKSVNQVFPFVFSDDQLEKMNIPTLLIYGEKECIYNIDMAANRATHLMKKIKVVIIPQANHLTAVSNPEDTNNAVLNFLKETNN